MPMRSRSVGRSTLAVLPALLVVSIWFAWPGAPAHAAADCVAAPNASAPQGSHWFYRRDPGSSRKCWFIAASRQKAARVATRIKATIKARTQRVVAQPAVAPRSPAPAADETAGIASPIRIQQLIYGTEQVEAVAPVRAEPVPLASPAPEMSTSVVQTANVIAPPATRNDAVDDADALPAAPPPRSIAIFAITRPGTTAAPTATETEALAHMMFVIIATVATAGSVLYTGVRLALMRRRRVRVERRRSYPFGQALLSYDSSDANDREAAAATTQRYAAA
jgi:hypothetical protein